MLDHSEHSFESRLAEISQAGAGGVLVGYSLGGRLALRAALRSPGSFRAVVTVGATAGIDEGPLRVARAEADEKLASWIETASMDDVVSLWERQPMFADQSDALVEAQRSGRLSHDQREAMTLRVIEGRPYEEIARTLSCTEQAARARVSRGLRRLTRLLDAESTQLREVATT